MKIETIFHFIISTILAWINAKFRTFSPAILELFFLMIIDYITGMLASRQEGINHPKDPAYGWSSRKGALGILKKAGCWLVIAGAFSIDFILYHSASDIGFSYPGQLSLGMLVVIWYSLNELLSIIENAGRMGVPIPDSLKRYIAVLKKDLDKKDGSS